MKKIEWTKRKIFQAVYWGAFVLMLVIAFVTFRQKGLWIQDYFGMEFYKLEAETDMQRVFASDDCVVTLTGSFKELEEVYAEVKPKDSEPILWTLTRGERNTLTASNEAVTYTGTYKITELSCDFSFDDWDDYMDQWSFSGNVVFIGEKYTSEAVIEGFIRMAYGHTDNFSKYSMEPFLLWILVIVVAYVIGFHAEGLFEWRKAWSFDIRNAEDMEPSGYYFFTSYVEAAFLWLVGLFVYLAMVGVIPQ